MLLLCYNKEVLHSVMVVITTVYHKYDTNEQAPQVHTECTVT